MVLPEAVRLAVHDGDTVAIENWFHTGSRDPDERDAMGWTLMHSAAGRDHCDVMRVLLERGARLDSVT